MIECTNIPFPVILAHFSYRGLVMIECTIIPVPVILAHFYRKRSCNEGVYYHTCFYYFSPLLLQTEVM